ncbi:hypothetical protein, partial [Duganella phyllosphaerae]|uniref:hypothetical protein n=1 Tax=Duganella phyllosphaerae TaxID=762836 RepID=UPI001ABF4836
MRSGISRTGTSAGGRACAGAAFKPPGPPTSDSWNDGIGAGRVRSRTARAGAGAALSATLA